jgi:histone acetyltransferase (RNA polymerase elongator complex component)
VKIYPVFIPHAGCPHRCLFCAQDRSTGQSAAPAAEELDSWLDRTLPLHGDGEIAFYGGTFSLLPVNQQERYLVVARAFVAAARVGGIRISTRPDALDGCCVARLKDAGVTTVEIGCQSFSSAVLSASGRGHSPEDSVVAIQSCRATGMKVGAQLMPGLPCGDAQEAMSSLQRALELEPSFLRIYPTVVIDGTGLAKLWQAGGYSPWSLDHAVDVCADMLRLCRHADMPVIRLGLQRDPQLEANLLAGPYHPAFGQLVRSRLWRRALQSAGAHGRQISVNPDDLSDASGHRGENRQWLAQHGTGVRLVTDKAVARGFLQVSGEDFSLNALSAHGGLNG